MINTQVVKVKTKGQNACKKLAVLHDNDGDEEEDSVKSELARLKDKNVVKDYLKDEINGNAAITDWL